MPVQNCFPEPSVRDRPAAEARAVLDDASFEEVRERGKGMTFEQAVAYALEDHDAPPN